MSAQAVESSLLVGYWQETVPEETLLNEASEACRSEYAGGKAKRGEVPH